MRRALCLRLSPPLFQLSVSLLLLAVSLLAGVGVGVGVGVYMCAMRDGGGGRSVCRTRRTQESTEVIFAWRVAFCPGLRVLGYLAYMPLTTIHGARARCFVVRGASSIRFASRLSRTAAAFLRLQP